MVKVMWDRAIIRDISFVDGTESFIHRNTRNVLPDVYLTVTSSARAHGDTICLRPLPVDNIFVFIRQQVAPVPACWLFRTSATSC